MISPCKDCEDRTVGCHGSCERYKRYTEEQERIRDLMHQDLEFTRAMLPPGRVKKARERARKKK